jgi:1-aminocyclopropane-1-carboxylate deaminase
LKGVTPVIQSIRFTAREVHVLRLDLIHPLMGGNKWYKLKFNLASALSEGNKTIVTKGGPHSNHIAATAEACRENGLKSLGIIRGNPVESPTIKFARAAGMQLVFAPVHIYPLLDGKNIGPFNEQLPERFHFVPEGGANCEGLKGCAEIGDQIRSFDVVVCACGTGTTFAGLAASASSRQRILGISVLKGENTLPAEARNLLQKCGHGAVEIGGNADVGQSRMHAITNSFAFSGYARNDNVLIAFKRAFEAEYAIPLDHVYTTKLFYATEQLILQGVITPDEKLAVVHSGGLQGNEAFEKRWF